MSDGFLFDVDRCTGCHACRLACTIENDLAWGTSWRRVYTFNEEHLAGVPRFHLSLACNHCAEAPCMRHCPALAYRRDPRTGAVILDPDRCIGCGYCGWVCPWDVPRYEPRDGVMAKCTLCNPRLLEGREPACVRGCPTGALGHGELRGSATLTGFDDADVGPAIRFARRAESTRAAAASAQAPAAAAAADAGGRAAGGREPVRLASEWPLVAFTLLAAVLVAVHVVSLIAPPPLPPAVFVATAVAGAALSTLHLGRMSRAWRAVLNFGRSWLSREIAFYGAFVALAGASLLSTPPNRALGWGAAAAGIAALFAINRVYEATARVGDKGPHSADVILTAAWSIALLLGQALPASAFGGLKALLYLRRKLWRYRTGRPLRPGWSLLRVALGFVLPAVLWVFDLANAGPWIAASILGGEAIDRAEFYLELEFASPSATMAQALDTIRNRTAKALPPAA